MTLCLDRAHGHEVWIAWDHTMQGFQLHSAADSGGDFLGCSDTLADARALAHAWLAAQAPR